MSDTNDTILDAIRRRSAQRRDVLKYAGQATAVAGSLTLLSACNDEDFTFGPTPGASPTSSPSPTPAPSGSSAPTPTPTPSPAPTGASSLAAADIPFFQFLLNIEYLRASFFLEVSNYDTLSGGDTSGIVGTSGMVGPTGAAILTPTGTAKDGSTDYTTAIVTYPAAKDESALSTVFATEMASVSVALVRKLRNLLGSQSIAMPNIDIQGSRTDGGAWYTLATGSTVTASGKAFNPSNLIASYLSASNFLNSVALAAYRGVIPLVTPASADILGGFIGTISYHTALQRTLANIQAKGDVTTNPLMNPQKFSDYVDTLDGTKTDLDQGPGPGADMGTLSSTAVATNVVASDSTNGLALARSPAQTLNVLYLNKAVATSGGFFPNGVNGTIVSSADTSTL